MTITNAQIATVQDSLAELRRHFDIQPTFFYDALFRHAPELRELFRDDLTGQGMKFMTTLEVIVQRLGDPDAVEPQYTGLGQTHRSLGVVARHFEPMEEALMDTLREATGAAFTSQVEAAWRAAYDEVRRAMVRLGDIPKA